MKYDEALDKRLFENRYSILLIATVLQVFLGAFFPHSNVLLLNGLTFSFFMLANINLIRHSRRIVIFMILFALISIALAWVPDQSDLGQKLLPYKKMIVILFIGVIIGQIVRQIIVSKKVSTNMIYGVITIYILFGLLAGECNLIIQYFDPAAFAGNLNLSDPSDLRYFSYVTITTLGYGDITPISQMARAAAAFFSLTAQIYLAVIIALIVGKYVSQSDKKEIDGM